MQPSLRLGGQDPGLASLGIWETLPRGELCHLHQERALETAAREA